jgi:hypothetical protein
VISAAQSLPSFLPAAAAHQLQVAVITSSGIHEDRDEVALRAACVDQSAVRPRPSTFVAPIIPKAEFGRILLPKRSRSACALYTPVVRGVMLPPFRHNQHGNTNFILDERLQSSIRFSSLFFTTPSPHRKRGCRTEGYRARSSYLGTLVKIGVEEVVITLDEDAEMMFGCVFRGWIRCRSCGGDTVLIEL